MADLDQPPEDIFVERFKEICLANPNIYKKISYQKINGLNVRQIYYNQSTPVGKSFPEVNYFYSPQISEEVLPSEKGILTVTAYHTKDTVETFANLAKLMGAIEYAINKVPHVFDEFDVGENKGLHCVRCVRTSRTPCSFDSGEKVYFITSSFDVRISDRFEDFANVNNQSWPPLI